MSGAVPGVLAPYVDSLHVYDVTGEPGVHIGLPSTALTLVLPLDEPLDVGWAGRDDTRGRFWGSVSGLHTWPAAIHHGHRQRGVMLGLTVAGARALLGVPAGELSGRLLDLEDVAPDLGDLPDRLAGAVPADRGRVVVRSLVSALARRDVPAPRAEVGRALARLTAGAGVAAVADEVGYSRRHLGDAGPCRERVVTQGVPAGGALPAQSPPRSGPATSARRRRGGQRVRRPAAPDPRVGRAGRLRPRRVAATRAPERSRPRPGPWLRVGA